MRILLSIIKWVFAGFALLLAAGLVLPQGLAFLDQLGKKERAAYLQEAKVYGGSGADLSSATFPPAFYTNRLFLFGEMHGVAGPQTVDLALMNHLNEKIGVRWLLAELGPETAMAFNTYLSTGDDQWARTAFDGWAEMGAQWGNKDFFAKLENIRADNAARPPENRVYFLGVDQIQNETLAANLPSALPAPIGPQALIARRTNEALLAATKQRDAQRYGHILVNIDLVLQDPDLIDEPFYGFWGLFHVLEVTVNGTARPLALRLKDNPAFGDRIATLLAGFGPGSFMMWPARMLPGPLHGKNGEAYTLLPMGNDNPYMGYMRGIRDLELANGDDTVSIFHMDRAGSPYMNGKRLVNNFGLSSLIWKFNIDGNISSAVDYVVYFNATPALTPWQGDAFDFTGRATSARR
ncbi:MAG: hypothetical protein AAFY32_07810 [Pseudomonadota bacterium]